ncbi:MAG: isoamylase early set domain-containing protein [Pseudomonadota bacterium]
MFTKKYLSAKPICKVSFKVLKKNIGDAQSVNIVGEWNNWDLDGSPMKKLKNGDFSCQIDLDQDKAFQFRYLVDKTTWFNDESADAYYPSPFPGIDNSVIAL